MSEPDGQVDHDYSYSVFDLHEGDLETNRTGRLSPRQKNRLMLSFILELLVALLLGALFIGVLIGFTFLIDVNPSQQWIVWIVDAILVVMILFIVYWIVQRARDVLPGTVAEFKGRVFTEEHEVTIDDPNADAVGTALGIGSTRQTIFSVFLGTQKFRVSQKTYAFLYSGRQGKAKPSFRVYYLPHTRRILAAEKIIDEPDQE